MERGGNANGSGSGSAGGGSSGAEPPPTAEERQELQDALAYLKGEEAKLTGKLASCQDVVWLLKQADAIGARVDWALVQARERSRVDSSRVASGRALRARSIDARAPPTRALRRRGFCFGVDCEGSLGTRARSRRVGIPRRDDNLTISARACSRARAE